MFFTIKSRFLPLYDDFKMHKGSQDTFILSKLTLPEQVELNKDNLIIVDDDNHSLNIFLIHQNKLRDILNDMTK
mgnify:CR=1 FL=1